MALIQGAGQRCGFDVLDLHTVPGLSDEHFADEQHINETGVPHYTQFVMSQLKQ